MKRWRVSTHKKIPAWLLGVSIERSVNVSHNTVVDYRPPLCATIFDEGFKTKSYDKASLQGLRQRIERMGPSGSNRQPGDTRRLMQSPSVIDTRYGTQMKWLIPSDLSRGREIQTRILAEVDRFHYNTDSVFAIKLALEEAIVNAIKHGNKYDESKKVYVEALIGPGQCEIQIEDEGPGFERSHVPDPTAPENLEKSSGRGILLIESYMTQVHWTHGGKRMHMIKRND